MNMLDELAVNGGPASVINQKPHYKWPILGTEEEQLVLEVMRGGDISIYGKSGVVAELEDSFAEFCKARYALSTNSGTSALFAAYFSLGLNPGDEIIVPTYTFPATVIPLLHFPVQIVLCDADPITGNVTEETIQTCLSERTAAVVVTHMWGLPCAMDRISNLCQKHGLALVEDASHAQGATYMGKTVGTFGDVGCFSLQGKKMMCAGEGGMLVTDNVEIYERATLFASCRKRPYETVKSQLRDFWETGFGLKLKIHPLGAAIALAQLKKTPKLIAQRHARLEKLVELLQDAIGIEPPITLPNSWRGAWYGFKPLYRGTELGNLAFDEYLKCLEAEGLQVHKPGTRPIHLTPMFTRYDDNSMSWAHYPSGTAKLCKRARAFPGAESYYSRAISVPPFTTEPFELVESYGFAFQKVGRAYAS